VLCWRRLLRLLACFWCELKLGAIAMGSPWNQTICTIFLDKYMSEVNSTKQYTEKVLRLMQLVRRYWTADQVSLNTLASRSSLAKLGMEVHQK
jgi:hypothetical protein